MITIRLRIQCVLTCARENCFLHTITKLCSDAHSFRADKEKKDEGEGKSNKGDRVIDWDAAWQQIGRELRGTGSTNPRDYVDMASQSRR